MSIFQSLRWRIQMWHGLLLLAVVAGFCGLAYRLQADNARAGTPTANSVSVSMRSRPGSGNRARASVRPSFRRDSTRSSCGVSSMPEDASPFIFASGGGMARC
jgi:hypothetical protein